MNAVTCELEAIRNQMVFEFLEDTTHGHFNRTTGSGILVVEHNDKQVEFSRWIRILAIGPEVETFGPGDIVLVENLRWTNMFKITEREYWITSDTEILAVWDDKDNLPRE